MFDWLGDIISGLGDAIGGVFDTLGQQISSAIWNTMLQWMYETIYNAVADFFSMMGNMGADIFELVPKNPYTSADLNYSNSSSRVVYEYQHPEERNVELVSAVPPNWDSYDTVFVGYPIWWGIAAWPVNGFVAANDFTGKTVIPFCTSASSGIGQSGTLLRDSAKGGNWINGMRFSSSASESTVKSWVASLDLN